MQRQSLVRDCSENFVFGSQAEDELFSRILKKLGLQWDDLHYQEYPACHFDAATSAEEDWKKRAENCLEHVASRVKEAKIKKIILCGNAAVAFLGLKEAENKAQSMSIFPFPLLRSGSGSAKKEQIDCIVLRSPAALLGLERARKRKSDAKERAQLLVKEKEIKSKILSSLELLLSSFLTAYSQKDS